MKNLTIFGFICFALNFFHLTSGTKKLCFVAIIYRHGDRAPVGTYPTDSYREESFWPEGWGQLTDIGKIQQYELGKWIRRRYCDFLPEKYKASDIYVRSTDVDRTLMSAYCTLAGLYQSPSDADGLPWQPVCVHTVPVTLDSVLAGHKNCSEYRHLVQKLIKSPEISKIEDSYKEVYQNLSKCTGLPIKCSKDCVFLYSTLNIQKLHGFRLPCWSKNYFPNPLKEISEFAFKLPCFTVPLKRLKCGPLLKDIIGHMDDKRNGKITQKMWMYSAHDTTLANLMQCLDVYDGLLPCYSSTIIFELFEDSNDYYVEISYKNQTDIKTLKLPDCDTACSFDCFKKKTECVIPTDWEKECQN